MLGSLPCENEWWEEEGNEGAGGERREKGAVTYLESSGPIFHTCCSHVALILWISKVATLYSHLYKKKGW